MTDDREIYKSEQLVPGVGLISQNFHVGVQHCLHALLKFGITFKDKTIQNLLNMTFEIILKIDENNDKDLSNSYAILQPLLLSLPFTKPMVLLDSSASMREFESFVSKAEESIMLIGEIDYRYADLIPKNKARIRVFCRPTQERVLLNDYQKNYSWEYKLIGKDKTYASEIINCVIVDGKRALLSREPFKDLGRDNFYKYIGDDEVSDLIGQIEEIAHIEILCHTVQNSSSIRKKILGELSKFPKHRKIIEPELEEMEADGLQGVLEYFKLVPERTEEALAQTLRLKNRKAVENEFSRRGIFSRVFVNNTLKNLLEKSVGEKYTPFLVLDESSIYLLLNTEGIEEKENVIKCCSDCLDSVERLFVTSDVYGELIDFLKDKIINANIEKIQKIKESYEKDFDALEKTEKKLRFTKNEKIAIASIAQTDNCGIITNSWEVAEMCKVNNIKTFSIMKFFEERKNEKVYKIFRIPVDEFRQGETA